MLDLFIGPLALAIRYGLILAAGALANAGLAVFDTGTNSVTFRLDHLAQVAAAAGLFFLALAWRWVAKRWGGRT